MKKNSATQSTLASPKPVLKAPSGEVPDAAPLGSSGLDTDGPVTPRIASFLLSLLVSSGGLQVICGPFSNVVGCFSPTIKSYYLHLNVQMALLNL